jgi:predicted component of type VI protein secretion system
MDVELVVERGSRKRQTIHLRSDETIIGRREGCDLRIPSGEVSRRHCRLSVRDGILTVEDLHSSNGTFLNGTRVTDSQIVQPGDRLDIGPVCFRVKYQLSPAAIDRLLDAPHEAAEDAPLLEIEEVAEEAQADVQPAQVELVELEESDTAHSELTEPESKEPAEAEVIEDEPAVPVDPETAKAAKEIFEDDKGRWQPPSGDIRDILSQLDDSK